MRPGQLRHPHARIEIIGFQPHAEPGTNLLRGGPERYVIRHSIIRFHALLSMTRNSESDSERPQQTRITRMCPVALVNGKQPELFVIAVVLIAHVIPEPGGQLDRDS